MALNENVNDPAGGGYNRLMLGSDGAGGTKAIQVDASGNTKTTQAASELHLGNVGGEGDLVDVTLSLDTSIYADGDVLADTQVVTNALRKINGTGILQSLLVLDEDDQGVAMDLLFFSANVSVGAENGAPSITDANMRNYLGRVRVETLDYVDWGGVRTATKAAIGLLIKSVTDSRDIYIAAVTRGGTPTHTASGIRLRLGFLWN